MKKIKKLVIYGDESPYWTKDYDFMTEIFVRDLGKKVNEIIELLNKMCVKKPENQ